MLLVDSGWSINLAIGTNHTFNEQKFLTLWYSHVCLKGLPTKFPTQIIYKNVLNVIVNAWVRSKLRAK